MLIEHWDGTTWSIVSSPNVGSTDNILTGAAAVSTSDIWAVGYHDNKAFGPTKTLIEQWNGTSWSVVPSPNVVGFGAGDNALAGVAAVQGSSQAWTVGNFVDSFGSPKTLTEFYC